MTIKKIIQGTILLATLTFLSCGKSLDATTSAAEDTSASGAAASSVGGSIASSSSSGTVATYDRNGSIWNLVQPSAFAANICATVKTANGAGCTTTGNAADIVYGACSFGTSAATWSGTQEITLVSPVVAVACGTFPTPGNSTLQRQFISATLTAGSGSRTTAAGTAVILDNASTNLSNFDNQIISANISSGGYGTAVTFSANVRTAVSVKQRVYVQGGLGFDHSVVGSVNIAESAGVRTVTGSTTVYHNKLKVVGTSVFTGVTYNDSSCVPVGGSIKTTFAAGANVSATTAGLAFIGRSETLAFNGDGTATYTDPTSASSIVKLSHCF